MPEGSDPLVDSMLAIFGDGDLDAPDAGDDVSLLKENLAEVFGTDSANIDGSTSTESAFIANYAKHTVGISNPSHFKQWVMGVIADAQTVGIRIESPTGLARYLRGDRP